jgi:hypothetical protein
MRLDNGVRDTYTHISIYTYIYIDLQIYIPNSCISHLEDEQLWVVGRVCGDQQVVATPLQIHITV